MDTGGLVKNGGLCLTASSPIELSACSAEKANIQQFTLEKNGNLHLTAHKQRSSFLTSKQHYSLGKAVGAAGGGALGILILIGFIIPEFIGILPPVNILNAYNTAALVTGNGAL